MHAAGGPDAFLEDHAVIVVLRPLAVARSSDEIDLFAAFDGDVLPSCAPGATTRAERPTIALCPRSRAAQVYVLDRERRERAGPAHRAHPARRSRASTSSMRLTDHPDGEAASAASRRRAASCASRRAASSPTCAASAGASRATARCSALDVRDGVLRARALSRRARPRLGRAALPDRRRGARVGRARATSSSTGAAPPRRRRLPRLAARQRLLRLAALVRDRPETRATDSGRCATSRRWSTTTSGVEAQRTSPSTPAVGARSRARRPPCRVVRVDVGRRSIPGSAASRTPRGFGRVTVGAGERSRRLTRRPRPDSAA